jgi:hypothetical protein
MPRELDLEAIKARWGVAIDPDDVATDVPDLIREVERLRHEVFVLNNSEGLDVVTANAEIKRLQRLLGEPFPSSDSYESAMQCLADMRALLAEVLSNFHEAGNPGYDAVRSGWVRTETLARWRSAMGEGT